MMLDMPAGLAGDRIATLLQGRSHTLTPAEISSLIEEQRGKTIVIKYGGNAMADITFQRNFAHDIVTLQKLGMFPVVVHGGGPQIDQALQKIGRQGTFIQGMRVTDEETMQVVEWVLAGEVQQSIVQCINEQGGLAVGLTGRDGGLFLAKKLQTPDHERPGNYLDLGHVGEVESVCPTLIDVLQREGFIPVISTIACDAQGTPYNINADLVAGKLAVALGAQKLLILSNIPGVMDKTGALLSTLTTTQIDALLADGALSGGMLPKISAALDAAKNGVPCVHIIDGKLEFALLLALLMRSSVGTLIHAV